MRHVDPVINFGKILVSGGYTHSATSISLTSGGASELPNPTTSGAFNLVWFNATDYQNPADDPNVEIVRCTGISGDTLAIVRAQEGTSATSKNTSGKVYYVILAMTKKTVDDLANAASYLYKNFLMMGS